MSQPPEWPPRGTHVPSQEFSTEERAFLLGLAHESVEKAARGDKLAPRLPPTGHLAEPRGVFTTLNNRGDLRGCVGYVLPVTPLYIAVADTARAAALEDTRFSPVSEDEAKELKISLSILSRPKAIHPDELTIGVHGLVVSMHGRRGLLLPQVPVEHGWDRVTFLDQTCKKAGLPENAWRAGATIEAFTAEVFGD